MKKFLALCSVIAIISLNSCGSMSLDFIRKNNETQTVDTKNIEKIKIDISVGDCNIIAGDSGEAVINASCEYKAVSEEKAQKAMDNTKLRCETQGDTLYIDFIDSETGKKIENTKNLVNIMTDIEVILPDNLKSFDVSTDVGDIEISDFSGAFDISSNVGDITAKNLTITDKSDFSADVGNVDCEISGLAETELEFKVNVGDVDLSLDNVEKSEIDISSDVGNIRLDTNSKSYEEIYSEKGAVEQEKKIIIDGRCTVEMKTDVGDIKIK